MERSDRIAELLDSLTREEKLSLVHGAMDAEGGATGYIPGVERLDVPDLRLVDGPLGVRVLEKAATAFPASIALASTFDGNLAREQGAAIGREANARGQDVLLGPGLNLIRVPHCGRNFEYFSEDPVVTGAFAAAVVDGIQSEDVIATPKHFTANNQERRRATISAEVDERTLRERYLPGFRAAVEAGAGAIMTSYNRVNGTHMSDHRRLLTEVLKDEWGFEGFVMSDWFGTESTVGAANGGLDLEMPGITAEEMMEAFGMPDQALADIDFGDEDALPTPETSGTRLFAEPLAEAIDAGDVPAERLDDMVARTLGQMERFGLLDGDADGDSRDGAIDTPEHRSLAEEIATRGIVLLENDGVLPLDDDADLALVGPAADAAMLGGGGSSEMTPFQQTSTVEGMRARAGGSVDYAQGVPEIESPSFFDGIFGDDEEGDDEAPDVDVDEAVDAARAADVAVVVVQDAATEADDREDLRLPGEQDELVEAVAAVNDRTVVIVQSSGPVEIPWRDDVAAIVEAWYAGQADGDAVSSVLYGDSDATGRLPVTFAPEAEYPATEPRQYPGVDGEVHYDEGVLVGYRHFDATEAEPTYPFGHGLSYADFDYRDVEMVDDDTVRVTVENTSERDGRDVVQVYVRPPAVEGADRPTREFAGHASVEVPAGGSKPVQVSLDDLAFRRFDEATGWTVDAGEYTVEVARSSRDVRAETTVQR